MRSPIHTLSRALSLSVFALLSALPSQAQTTAVTGGTLLPVDGPAIEGGVMLGQSELQIIRKLLAGAAA